MAAAPHNQSTTVLPGYCSTLPVSPRLMDMLHLISSAQRLVLPVVLPSIRLTVVSTAGQLARFSVSENNVASRSVSLSKPSRDIVFLETSKNFKANVTVSIIDVLGNVISSQSYARWSSPATINLSGLTQGVYFVRISSGSDVAVQRIVRN